MPFLLPRPAFVAAVNERIAWLAEHRSEDQLDNFLAGLAFVRERIERHPEAGPPLRQDPTHVVRMRLFPRPLPYLVYYGHLSRIRSTRSTSFGSTEAGRSGKSSTCRTGRGDAWMGEEGAYIVELIPQLAAQRRDDGFEFGLDVLITGLQRIRERGMG